MTKTIASKLVLAISALLLAFACVFGFAACGQKDKYSVDRNSIVANWYSKEEISTVLPDYDTTGIDDSKNIFVEVSMTIENLTDKTKEMAYSYFKLKKQTGISFWKINESMISKEIVITQDGEKQGKNLKPGISNVKVYFIAEVESIPNGNITDKPVVLEFDTGVFIIGEDFIIETINKGNID